MVGATNSVHVIMSDEGDLSSMGSKSVRRKKKEGGFVNSSRGEEGAKEVTEVVKFEQPK